MLNFEWLGDFISNLIPTAVAIFSFILCYIAYSKFSKVRIAKGKLSRISAQLVFISISLCGLATFILVLPLSEALKGQLFSLIGIVLSAAIALSSTTFIGNAMGGIMLNTAHRIKIGDYISVNNYSGRITERGLLQIEIQSEDRNLTVLPNLFIVTNPYKIIHSKGTLISVDVSLGYDTNRKLIEKTLIQAAENAGLESPFMQITALGDFSVNYRVSGVLKEVKHRVTAQTELYKYTLDALHEADIEIVSPNFMNTRTQEKHVKAVPSPSHHIEEVGMLDIESIVFDKAEQAETKDSLRKKLTRVSDAISKLQSAFKESSKESRAALKQRIKNLEDIEVKIKASIEQLDKNLDS